jgi:transposase-like protein
MAKRRAFSPEFKLETVLDLLRGEKSVAQICRERNIGCGGCCTNWV